MKIFAIIFLVILTPSSYSQTTAVTEKGDTVLLKKDGTWEFKTDNSTSNANDQPSLDTNSTFFVRDSQAQKVVKGQKVDYQLWYNSNKWNFTDLKNSFTEYTFGYKKGTAYCMIIPEKISLTNEGLRTIALANAKNAAEKVEVLDEDIRNVNGTYVYMMKFKGIIQGMKFIYWGYYYTDENRAIQFLVYTYQNLFNEYKPELEKMLDGLVLNSE